MMRTAARGSDGELCALDKRRVGGNGDGYLRDCSPASWRCA